MTMSQLLIVFLAIFFANMPFMLAHRLFFFFRLNRNKAFYIYLTEILISMLLLGVVAAAIERSINGAPYHQDWQFYAVACCLMLVFAFPGFIFRYLWNKRN